MKNKNKKYKSSVLVASLIIMSIVLVASLSVALVAVREKKASMGTSKTVTVFHSTDMLAETVLEKIQSGKFREIKEIKDALIFSCSGTILEKTLSNNVYKVELQKKLENDSDGNPVYESIDCNSSVSIGEIARIKVSSTSPQFGRAIEANVDCNIKNCQQLQNNLKDAEGYFCLASDINCIDIPNFTPIENFKGVLDGRNFVISGLKIDGSLPTAGLFGKIVKNTKNNDVEIKNLGIEDATVKNQQANSFSGALVGFIDSNTKAKITNCYVKGGTVEGKDHVGGIIGESYKDVNKMEMSECYSTAEVKSAGDYVGGLVGTLAKGKISQSYFGGEVSGTGSRIGGLVGFRDTGGDVEDSYYDSEKNSSLPTCGEGSCPSDAGKTTVEMKKEETFTDGDWSFYENPTTPFTWKIDEDVSYPCFVWQETCPKPED